MMVLMNGGIGLLRRSAECSCFPDYDLGIQKPFQHLRKRAAMGVGAWYCFHSQRLADQESSQWQYLRYSYQDLEIRMIDDHDENGNESFSA